MSWFRKHFGMDFVDVGIHAVMTGLMAAGVAETFRGPGQDPVIIMVFAGSLLAFAWRRQRGLAKLARTPEGLTTGQMAAARLEELEQRVADLEVAEARVLELEERLDFTERLLARTVEHAAVLPPAAKGDRIG